MIKNIILSENNDIDISRIIIRNDHSISSPEMSSESDLYDTYFLSAVIAFIVFPHFI